MAQLDIQTNRMMLGNNLQNLLKIVATNPVLLDLCCYVKHVDSALDYHDFIDCTYFDCNLLQPEIFPHFIHF